MIWGYPPKKCIQLAFCSPFDTLASVKTVCLTMRGCPEPVHEALKNSAKANRRSLTKESVVWLEKQAARDQAERPMPCREIARILREAHKGLTAEDRRQIA